MDTMQLGVATADITPPVGVLLCGYMPRRSESVGHPLRAEALVCQAGGGAWALVTADLLAVSRRLVHAVRADVQAATGIDGDCVMIAATHTHSGPRAFAAGWDELPEEVEYFGHLRRALAGAVIEAWQCRCDGQLVHARAQAPGLASNRRVRRPDGKWGNEWADPKGLHDGYCDETVELLGVRRPGGQLSALLVGFGCHPVCFNSKNTAISGDYPSYLKDALEARGVAATAMFAVTGHANVDPRHCVQVDPAVTEAMGCSLADVVASAAPSLAPLGGGVAAGAVQPWDMELSWALGAHASSYFQVNKPGQVLHSEAAAVCVGELAILGMPGETVSEYMRHFRQVSPFGVTIMLSVVNDFVGYLVTDEILAQGAYEAGMCPIRPAQAVIEGKGMSLLADLRRRTGAV